MPVFNWSQTAATNATADATINWAEGQAPSSVNDSARAMMAALAKYRDDVAGSITTAGTSTAYTVTSNSTFTSLATMANQLVGFVPHTTNGATVTLNVDALGAKPLRAYPSVELPAGVLVQGKPYLATYNNVDAVFYLHGTGGVTSIASNMGAFTLGTGLTNSTNDIRLSVSTSSNSLAADVDLNNISNYFDGPSCSQGTSGTWFASGQVTILDTATPANFSIKLWDGTTVINSAQTTTSGASIPNVIHLSGILASPAANIRISVKDSIATTGKIKFNSSGNSKDSTLTCLRIA